MAPPPPAPDTDPSMEEILASIRRILNEDPVSDAPPVASMDDGVLVLDKSMMRDPPVASMTRDPPVASMTRDSTVAAEVARLTAEPREAGEQMAADPSSDVAAPQTDTASEPPSSAPQAAAAPTAELVAPEAAAAAAMAMGNLMRTLAADRQPKVWSEGPTLEDLVRATLRPLLKEWLDANLPPIVERLVRAEIERVVGRVIP